MFSLTGRIQGWILGLLYAAAATNLIRKVAGLPGGSTRRRRPGGRPGDDAERGGLADLVVLHPAGADVTEQKPPLDKSARGRGWCWLR